MSSMSGNDIEILEVPIDDEASEATEESVVQPPQTKRTRKPLTGAAREKALANLEKARAKAALMRKKRQEQKEEMMMARESALLQRGQAGYGPTYYDEDEDSDFDEESDPEDNYIPKMYKAGTGRPNKKLGKLPIVSAVPLNDYDDYPPPKPRGRPRKAPSMKEQRLDMIERKINQIIDHVKVKKQPKKSISKTTVIMPPAPAAAPKAEIPAAAKKELSKVLNIFG